MSTPIVPQRPVRVQTQQAMDIPHVPPRPSRALDRSISRDREAAEARSPLNVAPFSPPKHPTLYQQTSNHAGSPKITRPPSVAELPLIGQEGNEYASFDNPTQTNPVPGAFPAAPQETSTVSRDLPMHAPTAFSPQNAVHTKVVPLVRPESNHDIRSPHAASSERPSSAMTGHSAHEDDEHGIPEIGLQVPMYPNAGDVQAPTPSQTPQFQSTGVGYFNNDGSRPSTTDGRRKSQVAFHGPPGSYGLHGHGMAPHDQFEKQWYQKHPDEMHKEDHGAHGPAMTTERKEWAMSSDDLNRLVRSSASSSIGFGTSPDVIGTPTEDIGHRATAQYSHKADSSILPPLGKVRSRDSRPGSQSYAESPLRSATFPDQLQPRKGLESESEDDGIHLMPSGRHAAKYDGAGYDPPTIDLGASGGNTNERGGYITEKGYGVPILASDEAQYNPGAQYMKPAISPEQQMREDEYFSEYDSSGSLVPSYKRKTKNRSRPSSRTNSRPGSIHHDHLSLSRFASHEHGSGTPLEEIEEYEPLFNDDEKEIQDRPLTAADKLKRPELEKHRFPSQDIWEDTPTSLQFTTTVDTEQEPEAASVIAARQIPVSHAFEHPDQEAKRKGEITEDERTDFLTDSQKPFAKPKFNKEIQSEVTSRPGLRNRFPSQDIWEDTPDSLSLTTEIDSDDQALTSPTSAKLPAKQSGIAQAMSTVDRSLMSPPDSSNVQGRPMDMRADDVRKAQSSIAAQSQVKTQQISRTERTIPSIPDRPKPQVPLRPTRDAQEEQTSLSKSVSAGSDASMTSPPVPKTKPAVPSRPQGIASIKAGFMSDLNSRLQLGPRPPSKAQPQDSTEEDEEKAPLADPRKSRARGPMRRKPAVSPTPSNERSSFSLSMPRAVWSIPPTGEVQVHATTLAAVPKAGLEPQIQERATASPLSTNTAGEKMQLPSDTPEISSGAMAHASSASMDTRARNDEQLAKLALQSHTESTMGFHGDVPENMKVEPTAKLEKVESVKHDAGVRLPSVESAGPTATLDNAPAQPHEGLHDV